MRTNKFTTLLCILDGFGLNPRSDGNAIAQARKPNFDNIWKSCPSTTLVTHGERVGLPDGQMGNSEVGHLNIGAGRVVEQWLLKISRALKGSYLDQSNSYLSFKKASKDSKVIHLVGLYSDGGVHSHNEHADLLIARVARDFPDKKIFLHLITDGRDTGPERGASYIESLLTKFKSTPTVMIGTIVGRFYAMDRDKRWERVKRAYDAFVGSVGDKVSDPISALRASYAKGVTDEFIEPLIVNEIGIGSDDAVLFWNFREDRMREIVRALCASDFTDFVRPVSCVAADRVLGFTEYDHTNHLPYLFEQDEIKNHLGEVVSSLGLSQLRVAETEKYPHVTYFLNGGIEKEYRGEERKMCPSPRDVKTYDLKPQMAAYEVCDVVVQAIKSRSYDLIVVNFANCDMVGHTGILSAAIKAVETVDECLGKILGVLGEENGKAVILADHGNAEQLINYTDGTPHTAHTTYPVPCLVVGAKEIVALQNGGALCDVAPTVLKIMGIAQPAEMSGKALF